MSVVANSIGVTPAALSFFAIYNPSLNHGDETIDDQIVYFYDGGDTKSKGKRPAGEREQKEDIEEANKRLRSIGLAQAMTQFARDFSNETPIDSVDTKKLRVVVHRLEDDWWLLISVRLTCIPKERNSNDSTTSPEQILEYSSREVSPAALLLQQLLRAHNVFLLHHATSLADLFSRTSRERFCGYLKTFWDRFLGHWDVLLHGNPAVDVYNGLKLAASGELGKGTGEEHRGNGEREVLEGFVQRTDGLVDLLVSRFGCLLQRKEEEKSAQSTVQDWNVRRCVEPDDGVIFSGVGVISSKAARDVSAWMEWIAISGKDAYGIHESPTSRPRRKRDRAWETRDNRGQGVETSMPEEPTSLNSRAKPVASIPAPIVRSMRAQSQAISTAPGNTTAKASSDKSSLDASVLSTEMMKYLTFGVYGSSWGIPAGRPTTEQSVAPQHQKARSPGLDISGGHFLVGLLDKLEDDISAVHQPASTSTLDEDDSSITRISVRSLQIECLHPRDIEGAARDDNESDHGGRERLRTIIYLQPPFMFTFLFEPNTEALALASFYRSLHHQLGPLKDPLEQSTNPDYSRRRLWDAVGLKKSPNDPSTLPIQDLVYDPARLTVRSSIPDIPEPRISSPLPTGQWNRVEALSVHLQVLNIYVSTRHHLAEVEQSCKTSRSCWMVWMRLPAKLKGPTPSSEHREAILVRRGDGQAGVKARYGSSSFGFALGRNKDIAGKTSNDQLTGMGIDTKRYIEGLLSLSR